MFGDDEEVVMFQANIENDKGSEDVSEDKAPSANSLEVENVVTEK